MNAVRDDGPDGGWTMDERNGELMRGHVLDTIDEHAVPDGTVALKLVVDLAQERYATHPLFPKGRVRNDCTFTKVDLEARCEVERVPRKSPQRIRRWRPDTADAPAG
jgi:glyoxylate carboligase